MAETLLLPVVRAAAGKAADALVQRVTSMCGVDDDRHKLERQLLAVQYKLADAEMKSETNQYIKRWMKDFRTVTYEANDVLDGFQYEALRREAQIGNSKARKVLCHFTSHSPLLFRFDASRKLSNVLKKINELVEEMNKFGLVEHTEPPQLLYRQTHSALDDSADIFGRDDDKELLVKLLLDQSKVQVQVLPIFGMGGLGKTTLAKMVYNDGRVQQHFQLNMWHCVSENFEAVHLVKSFIELATQTECNLPNTIELLRGRLQEVIGHKRFLLVLDDVWNEEKRKWEDDLKPLLCSLGGLGSVIVVTCRSQQVASIMTTLKPHELACLSEDDSWELFSKKAFCNGVEEQAELVTIGRAIVKKCRGLPLALKTIGGLMSSKQQVWEWKAIEESNIGDNACGKHEIISVLKLSYRHLPSEMKQCFAFCSVFAKDCEMEKDMLIQLWIANGLIQEERTMDLSQKGELIFHYLVWRSFLQDVKEKEVQFGWIRHKQICCKMHDLMHDLAKDVTDECATVEDLIQQRASINDTRHMQIITRSEVEQINGLLKGKADLHTLLEPCTPNKNLKELRLMSLRALHLYVPSIIHKQVLNAKHLRYLDLSESCIVRLPDSVCLLYNLQTLRLNGCRKLQLLPEDTSAMRKLMHIYLLGCDSLERMPQKFSLLKNLHALTTFVVDSGDGRGINELKDLRHLANRLELYNLRKVKSGQDAKEANLHQKQNIRELSLYWGRSKDEKSEQEACTGEQVLDCLAPHSNLQILEVAGYLGLKVSRWMRDPQMFQWLRRLIISNCPSCEDLPVVWLSVSLEYLFLKNLSSLTTLGKMTEVEAEGYNTHLQIFPKLKEMALYDLPSLDRWMENSMGEPINSTVFPMLEVLHINNCPKIASVPGSPVLKHLCIAGLCCPPISSLTHLTTVSYLRYHGNDAVCTSIPMRSWPCLEKLEVQSLANMMAVPLEDQQSRSRRRALETLRSLSLYGPNCFVTSSVLSKSHLGYWECFAFVEELAIHYSNELVLWPMEELQHLARLRSLSIFSCANLEGKVSPPEQTFPLPQLERLDIRNCHSLMELPKLPTSLEQLKLFDCEKLVALPSNLGDLVKLRDLNIGACRCLKVLPDGMDHLTCLEQLWITRCPGIEKFPQGLHDRLHALGTLVINNCPELERRCREGGEYFHSVSSVPQKSIRSTITESSNKNFLRRLVPSCASSN
uniref:Uncharacterized protein n=1 Tax=Avena sativa TaxID=4498 RepID=A0ACD5ZNN5_AVESA